VNTSRRVVIIVLLATILASLPYVFGYFISPPGQRFMGLTYNIDDACVYLSWMRQAADGHLLIRNQFAVEPQKSLQFNILFLVLGWLARLSHLPLIAVYHLARIAFGILLLWLIYRFAQLFFENDEPRIAVLILAAFSSGVGWVFGHSSSRTLPVDLWQPEAITFLSLYLNPLFLCAQALMLATLMLMMRCRETRRTRDAAYAGICLLLLANIHTYDVVTVVGVWTAFLVTDFVSQRRLDYRLVSLSALAGMISLPALLYQWYLLRSEEVFRLRVATPALSPPLWQYLAGFGLVLLLAILAVPQAIRRRNTYLLPLVWIMVGFALPYAPFSQQRKLIMGIHIPLVILAACAIAWLSKKVNRAVVPIAVLAAIMAVPSNLLFVHRDMDWLVHNQTATRMHRPFLSDSELDGLQWLRVNSKPSDSVLAFPDIAVFVPELTGAATYVGHWSETPHFTEKLGNLWDFASAGELDYQRREFLAQSRTRYIWWDFSLERLPARSEDGRPQAVFAPERADYLKPIFRSHNIAIYEATK
jgi:hypothetical protein